jgi:hypothetical protein
MICVSLKDKIGAGMGILQNCVIAKRAAGRARALIISIADYLLRSPWQSH